MKLRKKEHPIVQVAVYDGVESVNKIIELAYVMTTPRDVPASSPDICRGQISWDYDRAEIIADGVVHAIGDVIIVVHLSAGATRLSASE